MNIIPQPKTVAIKEGTADFSRVVLSDRRFEFERLAEFLPEGRVSFEGEPNVVYAVDADIPSEGYKIEIGDKIKIFSSQNAGLFYAVETLKQIFAEYGDRLPRAEISDEPLYDFRSFLLDNGRYYYKPDDVKSIIDLAASHKYNVLHWHLTEDQGWRIQIDKYPLLTEFGSRRSHTNFNIFKPHGGFYTKEEIKDIVNYARQRHMIVVPELDMPGHMRAAIACYPELACFARKLSVATHFGVKHDILCAGKPEVFNFIYDVLEEVFELFPDKYIHLGGDEAVKHRWNLCPLCAKTIEENGLSGADELQAYFLDKVADFCIEKGKVPMIWHYEQAKFIKNKDLIFQYYFGDAGLGGNAYDKEIAEAVNAGRKIFNSSSCANYLDLPYGSISLKQAYCYDPMVEGIEKKENMIGVEACLWTEYVPNLKNAQVKTLPRLAALSERAWSGDVCGWDGFFDKMPAYYAYIKGQGIKIASLERAMPGKLRGKLQKMWFGRRVLHWQGLYNLIDDAAIERRAKREKLAKKTEN